MTAWLQRVGHPVNHKRVRRLMRLMGLEAIYPKPWRANPVRIIRCIPIFLKELESIILTMSGRLTSLTSAFFMDFVYLVVVMDWYSRYILSWELSITLEKDFCIQALERSLTQSKLEIFNTDQGAQFTSREFTGRLEEAEVRVSMDGRGRLYDNIFVERLWRTIKYKEVYLHDYRMVREAREGLERYFHFYNKERPQGALDNQTPHEVYFGTNAVKILHIETRV